MSSTTPWEALRDSDGSPHVLRFDWYDDHSSWRLEDLSEQIDQALALLNKHGVHPDRPDYVHELPKLAGQLRVVHRDRTVTDEEVRTALHLADELDVGDHVESFDAECDYESVLDHANELLTAWDNHHKYTWTDDEYNVEAVELLERLRQGRNGLGERWTLTVADDHVELPDGTIVKGITPPQSVQDLFTEIYSSIESEEDLPAVLSKLERMSEREAMRATPLLGAVLTFSAEIDYRTVATIFTTASNESVSDEQLNRLVSTVEGLLPDWHQDLDELISTASALAV